MLTLLLTRVAFAEPTAPSDDLRWPRGEASTDTVLVISHSGPGEVGDLVVSDPAGNEVEVARYDLSSVDGIDWAVLVPLVSLAPGRGYTLVTMDEDSPHPFDVSDTVAEVGTPNLPLLRTIQSEVIRQDPEFADPYLPVTSLDYQLCDPAVLSVMAVSDSEPPIPTLADLGSVVLTVSDVVRWSDGLSPGLETTAWLGGFDGAGRFVGWTADPVVMPAAGTWTRERADGVFGGPDTTPAVIVCPESGAAWNVEWNVTCDVFVVGPPECFDVEEDENEPPTGTEATGRGCDTAPAGESVLAVWAALVLLGRRRHT